MGIVYPIWNLHVRKPGCLENLSTHFGTYFYPKFLLSYRRSRGLDKANPLRFTCPLYTPCHTLCLFYLHTARRCILITGNEFRTRRQAARFRNEVLKPPPCTHDKHTCDRASNSVQLGQPCPSPKRDVGQDSTLASDFASLICVPRLAPSRSHSAYSKNPVSMANQVKNYFLSPSSDYPPGGPLALGNIIISPKRPVPPLAQAPSTPLPDISTSKDNFQWTRSHNTATSVGGWSKFLELVSFHASANSSSTVEEIYSFTRMDTTEFFPDDDFVRKAMAAPAIGSYLARQRFRKSVYIVVGIKTVTGARVRTVRHSGRGGGVGGGLDLSLAGGPPVAVGADFNRENGHGEELEFTDDKDFVFAFRVRKVRVRKSGRVDQDEYNRDGLLGLDDDDAENTSSAFTVDGIDDADETGEEFQFDFHKIAEGEDEIRVYSSGI